MGRYRLGNVIRMTRKSLSITQEQLCEGICSVETLSRMESGKQNPNRETYELLMERMGRIRDRAYSMLSISDFKLLEKKKQFEDCIQVFNYEQADIILSEIKQHIGNTVLDRQFLLRAEALIDYRLKRITVDKFEERLEEAIKLTIPQFGTISISACPLNYSEVTVLLNLTTTYADKGDYDKSIHLLEDYLDALRQSYMDEEQRVNIETGLLYNLSKWYGLSGDINQSIHNANKGIEICKEYKLGNALPYLLYNVVWNTEKLIDQGMLPKENKEQCLQLLLDAYYIACAMQLPYMIKFLNEHINVSYNILPDLVL